MALIRMGALIGIGALINKSTFESFRKGELTRKGALIARALNRIITVHGECRNKNCFEREAEMTYNKKKKRKTNKDMGYNNSSRSLRVMALSTKCDSLVLRTESR